MEKQKKKIILIYQDVNVTRHFSKCKDTRWKSSLQRANTRSAGVKERVTLVDKWKIHPWERSKRSSLFATLRLHRGRRQRARGDAHLHLSHRCYSRCISVRALGLRHRLYAMTNYT